MRASGALVHSTFVAVVAGMSSLASATCPNSLDGFVYGVSRATGSVDSAVDMREAQSSTGNAIRLAAGVSSVGPVKGVFNTSGSGFLEVFRCRHDSGSLTGWGTTAHVLASGTTAIGFTVNETSWVRVRSELSLSGRILDPGYREELNLRAFVRDSLNGPVLYTQESSYTFPYQGPITSVGDFGPFSGVVDVINPWTYARITAGVPYLSETSSSYDLVNVSGSDSSVSGGARIVMEWIGEFLLVKGDFGGSESCDGSFNSPDGMFDAFDVEGFLLALNSRSSYLELNPCIGPTLVERGDFGGNESTDGSFNTPDGVFNELDVEGFLLALNDPAGYAAIQPPPPITAAIPEPAALGLLAPMGLLLARRRR